MTWTLAARSARMNPSVIRHLLKLTERPGSQAAACASMRRRCSSPAARSRGSFSKILAPGLRLGYVVVPDALMPKLLQARQAADLHTSSFNQRIAFGMRLPAGLDAMTLLPRAVAAGVAFVPGAPFFANEAGDEARRCLRLSFVTLAPAQIEQGLAALGGVLHGALAHAAPLAA